MNKTTIQVFISYSHHDHALAEHLSQLLEGYGFSVWWDHALLGGDNFRTQIAERIHDAKVVLVLFSKHSINSGWVLDEAGRAAQANKLVPIRVGEVDIPLGFGHLHRCEMTHVLMEPDHPHIEAILYAVEHFTAQERIKVFDETSLLSTSTTSTATTTKPVQRTDRFAVNWLPDRKLLNVVAIMGPIYLLALVVAFVMTDSSEKALHEWVKLLHVYSGMVTLGGGVFLSIVFRLSDQAPTPMERAAITDVARPMCGGWRLAAIAQFITGFLLIFMMKAPTAPGEAAWTLHGWLIQSIILYVFALYLWWAGFEHALRAAKYDILFQIGEHIRDTRQVRNQRLLLATILTAWVLVTMIYKQDADLALLLGKLLM